MPFQLTTTDLYYMTGKDSGEALSRTGNAEVAFKKLQHELKKTGEKNCDPETIKFEAAHNDAGEAVESFFTENKIDRKDQVATAAKIAFLRLWNSTELDRLYTLTNKTFDTVLDINVEEIQTDTEAKKKSVSELVTFIESLKRLLPEEIRGPLIEKIKAIEDKLKPTLSKKNSESKTPPDNQKALNITSFEALNLYIEKELPPLKDETLENQLKRYQNLKKSALEIFNNLMEKLVEDPKSEPKKKTSFFRKNQPDKQQGQQEKSSELRNSITQAINKVSKELKKKTILSEFDKSLEDFESNVKGLKCTAEMTKSTNAFIDELKKHRNNFDAHEHSKPFKQNTKDTCEKYKKIYSKKTWFKKHIDEPFEKLKNKLYQLLRWLLGKPGLFKPKPSLLDEFEILQEKLLKALEEKTDQIKPPQNRS
ncbi:MAG: hypothetical protein QNK11_07700 [Legionella sp.]|nr:hypothetical protein [Legionella sp.]